MLRCKRTISITSLQAKANSTQIAFHLLSRELSTLFKFNLPHNLRLPDCSDRQKQSHLRVLWKKKKATSFAPTKSYLSADSPPQAPLGFFYY